MAESQAGYEFADFEYDGVRVLRVGGEFGLEAADALRDAIRGLLEGGAPAVLDLSGVEFMDSTGLSVVLNALKEAWGSGQALLIAGPLREPIGSLMNITGMSRYLTVHASWNAAVEALSRSAAR